jgi:hypothetical protein
MKDHSQVKNDMSPTGCGIVYDSIQPIPLIFYLPTYFSHFKDAVQKYHDELLGITTNPNITTKDLQSNFSDAYNSLELSKNPTGMASTGGGGFSLGPTVSP